MVQKVYRILDNTVTHIAVVPRKKKQYNVLYRTWTDAVPLIKREIQDKQGCGNWVGRSMQFVHSQSVLISGNRLYKIDM